MSYYLFIIVCIAIHIVVNIDIFRKKPTVNLPALHAYRIFVLSVFIYFISDLIWGIFDEIKIPIVLYVDTVFYFIFMGFTILAWAKYVVSYLETKGILKRIILYVGNAFFLAEIVLLIINIFVPIFFKIDMETGEYTSLKARNIMLYVQILFYFMLTIYSGVFAFKSKSSYRRRNMTITLYSIIMFTTITIQIYHPLIPLYSMGCVIGAALLNAFVITDIKEDYKEALQESRVLVKQGQIQLSETMVIAYSDPMTNVKNKHAYVEEESRVDKLIAEGKMEDFAVVVFDLNDLKKINDTKGHEVGDEYIINACRTIEKYFGKDNLYRYGGDEFVKILFGQEYENRTKSLSSFESFIDSCLDKDDKPIIASGMSKYRKNVDNTYQAVFNRADKIMYSHKEALKEQKHN